MDRDELNDMLQSGPVRLTMNNGDIFDIMPDDEVIVSDLGVHLLRRKDQGQLPVKLLATLNISSVDVLETP